MSSSPQKQPFEVLGSKENIAFENIYPRENIGSRAASASDMIKNMFHNSKEHDFQKLVQLDFDRQEIIEQNQNWVFFYFSMKGKSVFLSFLHPYFFLTFLVFGIFRYWIHKDPNDYNQSNMNTMSIASGLMSFLLVFYLQQSYTRYLDQYKAIVNVQDRIQELFTYGRLHLSHEVMLTLWRYVNATHLLAYTSLSSNYNKQNFFEPINEKYLLLTPEEQQIIFEQENDDSFHDARVTYTWCVDLIAGQFKGGKVVINEEGTLLNMLNQFKTSLFTLFSYRDNPIPFSYTHFVKIMELIYLPILAYTFANFKDMYKVGAAHEVVTVASLFIVTLFFIGLIELTNKFQDPFGDDIEDFRVLHFLEQSAKASAAIISIPRQQLNEQQEKRIWDNRIGVIEEIRTLPKKRTTYFN